jgi:cell pole-organizing protein PopZ
MAQASSVQREPSMEEILASIRRIIEDSDGGRTAVDQGAPPTADMAAPTPSKAEVESFRTELGTVAPPAFERKAAPPQSVSAAPRPGPSPVAELAPKPFRLAEVQAQVAREAAAAKPVQAELQPVTPPDLEEEITAELEQEMTRDGAWSAAAPVLPAAQAPAARQPAPRQVEPRASADTLKPVLGADPEQTPRAVVSTSKREERPAAPTAAQAPAAAPAEPAISAPSATPGAQRPSIISPAAGRQVAAAFGELSEAFAARSKKTLDELAEQILRPMLQEWLDNNLPLLVEKLVREEIERVARGS